MSWYNQNAVEPRPEYVAEALYPSGEHVACQVFDAGGNAVGPELELLEGLRAMRDRPAGWELRRVRDGRPLARVTPARNGGQVEVAEGGNVDPLVGELGT